MSARNASLKTGILSPPISGGSGHPGVGGRGWEETTQDTGLLLSMAILLSFRVWISYKPASRRQLSTEKKPGPRLS